MKAEYYWFDTGDNIACGTYETEASARTDAEAAVDGVDNAHKHDILIVKVVARSPAISLKRKWKGA